MKNWYKVLSLLLVLVMSFSIVACGSKKQQEQNVNTGGGSENSAPSVTPDNGTTGEGGSTDNGTVNPPSSGNGDVTFEEVKLKSARICLVGRRSARAMK